MNLVLKRVYEQPSSDDGERILVERLWPRGLSKEAARLDGWFKDLAPSPELRCWFGHVVERWPQFRRRYEVELAAPEKQSLLAQLAAKARSGRVTLPLRRQRHGAQRRRGIERVPRTPHSRWIILAPVSAPSFQPPSWCRAAPLI